MKIKIMARKKEILDEIENLEKERQKALALANDIFKRQTELKGGFNELNKLEKDAE